MGYIGGVSDVLPGTSRVRSILHVCFLVGGYVWFIFNKIEQAEVELKYLKTLFG